MEFLQHLSVILTIFLVSFGLFNKANRYRFYALAVLLLAISYGIHNYRLAYQPGYAKSLEPKSSSSPQPSPKR